MKLANKYWFWTSANLVQLYKSYVESDGGEVIDESYLSSRIAHAKANGYINDITFWAGSSFGVKKSANLVSKVYDIITPADNSLVSTVGSEQPEFISSGQNSKSAIRSDGVDDSLYTTHSNTILGAGKECVVIFVFKPLAHSATATRSYFQNKQSTGTLNLGLIESINSLNYNLSLINRNSTADQILPFNRAVGIANNEFVIGAFNLKSKGTWALNDIIGNYYPNVKTNTAGLDGISLFGNYSSTPATFSASKTQAEFYEMMIIETSSMSYELLQDIKAQINTYYNKYTAFDYNKSERLLNGVSNLDGVFSFYNRVTGYSGNCLRLRRDSDNAESDFGFVNDYIDLASITSWAGGANLFVRTWYDQSGLSNFEQSTTSLQFQFFTTGGGNDNAQPYIKAIAASNTKMNRTSSLTSADLFKAYLVTKRITTAGTVFAAGASTNYINLGLPAGGIYGLNKRASAANYIKRSSDNWYQNGSREMMIVCFGNTATTPSRDDLLLNVQTREDLTVDSAQYVDAGSNTMSIGRGNGGASYDGHFYELFVIKNITHNQKELEMNLVRVHQQLD